MFCQLTQYNLLIVDFYQFFDTSIKKDVVNTCYEYGLYKNNCIDTSNKDTKKIFYHYIIKHVCDYNLTQEYDVVFTFDPTKEYLIDQHDIGMFLNKIIKDIKNNLPITFIEANISIDTLCSDIINKRGEVYDFIQHAINNTKKTKGIRNLSKAKRFALKHNLYFINDNILNNIVSKSKFFI